MAIGQRRVGQRPQVLSWLEFRRVGWQKEQMDMVGHAQVDTAVPARAVKDEHNLLVWARAHLARKGSEFDLEERDIDGGGEVKDGATRGGMHKSYQVVPLIAPLVAVFDRRNRPLAVETPDFVQDRFETSGTDAMLISGPEFDRVRPLPAGRRWWPPCAGAASAFLKAFCAAGSACTWRGRGFRRLPLSRTRYVQPR